MADRPEWERFEMFYQGQTGRVTGAGTTACLDMTGGNDVAKFAWSKRL